MVLVYKMVFAAALLVVGLGVLTKKKSWTKAGQHIALVVALIYIAHVLVVNLSH
jgi:uncharacterized membrane protein SirB2